MAAPATVAPVLSTPDTRLAESPAIAPRPRHERTDAQLSQVYEVERTVAEIRRGKWKRIALQFPDNLLPDAPRVYQLLSDRLSLSRSSPPTGSDSATAAPPPAESTQGAAPHGENDEPEALYVLADTSYGACCADEIAAEHVDAQVIVHYGRACLSPTARLPVIHVFTEEALDIAAAAQAFEQTYPDRATKAILMADAPYACHVPALHAELAARGYTDVFATAIRHDPSSALPNRTIPPGTDSESLRAWSLFHVSDPPPALLLTLSSRVAAIHVYPTEDQAAAGALQASTAVALRRRYALLARVSRAAVIGILVNTLSVHAYQDALRGTQRRIADAGKKAYVFAMGRPNPAKVANFAEVDGWVVLGCWESSLIENSEFHKPLVAPFELELALRGDKERVWTGEWRGDFANMAAAEQDPTTDGARDGEVGAASTGVDGDAEGKGTVDDGEGSESESEPPEFDLRTGRYIQPTRPMAQKSSAKATNGHANALTRRAKGDLAIIGGEVSPGAQYLRDKRTWKGLGSDFEIAYEEDGSTAGAQIKEGRSGIARGYEGERHNGQNGS